MYVLCKVLAAIHVVLKTFMETLRTFFKV